MDGRRDGLNEGLLYQRREKWQMGEGRKRASCPSMLKMTKMFVGNATLIRSLALFLFLSSFSHGTLNGKTGRTQMVASCV